MRSLFLFAARESPLHNLDPRTKVGLVLAVLAMVFAHGSVLYIAGVFVLLVLVLFAFGRIGPNEYADMLVLFLPLIVAVTLINAFSRPNEPGGTILLGLGPLAATSDGARFGLLIAVRLAVMGLTFATFTMTTNPMDISLALAKIGVPYRYGYLSSFALRFLPLLQDEMMTLLSALAARGHPHAGSHNPVERVLGIVYVSPSLAVGFLRRATDVALAMELRGYRANVTRTYMRQIQFAAGDAIALAGGLAFVGVSVYLKTVVLPM